MAFPTVRRFKLGKYADDGLNPGWQSIRNKNQEGVKEFAEAMRSGLVDTKPPVDFFGDRIVPAYTQGGRASPSATPLAQGGVRRPAGETGESLVAEVFGVPPDDVESLTEGIVQGAVNPVGPGQVDSYRDFLAREYDQATGTYLPIDGTQVVRRNQDAYVINPLQFIEEHYGADAATQVGENFLARNAEGSWSHRNGMPEVHPEGILRNLTDDYIYLPYRTDLQRAMGSHASANMESRLVMGHADALPHENFHMMQLNGLPDPKRGIFLRNLNDLIDHFMNSTGTGDDPGRGMWLTRAVMEKGGANEFEIREALDALKGVNQDSGTGLYNSTYPEMMAEAAQAKFDRIYPAGGGARRNSHAGDMEVLYDIVNNPKTQSEKAISIVYKYLPAEEKQRFEEMFFRLGAVMGPAALGAALLEEDQ